MLPHSSNFFSMFSIISYLTERCHIISSICAIQTKCVLLNFAYICQINFISMGVQSVLFSTLHIYIYIYIYISLPSLSTKKIRILIFFYFF
jgi:hypothetical protein